VSGPQPVRGRRGVFIFFLFLSLLFLFLFLFYIFNLISKINPNKLKLQLVTYDQQIAQQDLDSDTITL